MSTIIAATALALFMQSAPDTTKTDCDYEGLTGRVSVVETFRERTVQSGSDKGKVLRERDKIAVYDRSGWLVEEFSFGFEGCTLSRHVFRSEGRNNRTETVYWGQGIVDANGVASPSSPSVDFKQTLTFDGSGNRVEVAEFDPQGKSLSITRHKYDDRGRLKETSSDYGSSRSECSFKYDGLRFPGVESCRRTGGMESAEEYRYKYEVDSAGNWVKRSGNSVSSFNGKTGTHEMSVTYRTIEYYPAETKPSTDTFAANGYGSALKPCGRPLVIRKSGGVLQQSATKRVTPTYPAAALAQKISGAVLIELTIDEIGKVISARSISGPAELRGAAEEAARGWEFAPTYLSKMPVKVIGTITFNFNR